MIYTEAKQFIDSSNKYGSILGLETVSELLKRLSNPQEKLKVIHVAGTNGKGSTAAFIASILAAEGYLVGRFLSPSVFHYREIIQLSRRSERKALSGEGLWPEDESIVSEYITEDGVTEAIEAIRPVCEAMVRDGFAHPTSFEIETAMALFYFVRQKVDFAVVEVGLGGRLDATNVVNPVCSVITSVSMDHMQYLGDTIEEIAQEKAGIIKKGASVITCNKNEKVLQVLNQACLAAGTVLQKGDHDQVTVKSMGPEGTIFRYRETDYQIGLLGEYQIDNALNAIHTAMVLREQGYPISSRAVQTGLKKARWHGRFDIIAKNPTVILDGAHNEDAALQLKKAVEIYFDRRRVVGIMGVFADKEYKKILSIMAPCLSVFIAVTPENSRALSSEQLSQEARLRDIGTVIDGKTVRQALRRAYQEAAPEDVILVFGSLSFLGEVYHYIIPHPGSEAERC